MQNKIQVNVLGFFFPDSPYGLCGSQATFELEFATELRSCVKVEVDVLGFFFPNSPYGLCES